MEGSQGNIDWWKRVNHKFLQSETKHNHGHRTKKVWIWKIFRDNFSLYFICRGVLKGGDIMSTTLKILVSPMEQTETDEGTHRKTGLQGRIWSKYWSKWKGSERGDAWKETHWKEQNAITKGDGTKHGNNAMEQILSTHTWLGGTRTNKKQEIWKLAAQNVHH